VRLDDTGYEYYEYARADILFKWISGIERKKSPTRGDDLVRSAVKGRSAHTETESWRLQMKGYHHVGLNVRKKKI
jgi:hypothetical protein